MGVSSSKITAEELQKLLEASKRKCVLYSNKKLNEIKNKKNEIINCLKQNNMALASAKMDNMLKDEDYVEIYKVLYSTIEIIKEKCTYIVSNKECPTDIRAQLDTLIYSSKRLEIDELIQFREKIKQKYGEAYIIKADNNTDKFVNVNLAEKLKATPFSKTFIDIRIKQLCNEKNIKYNFPDDIPSGIWEVKPSELNMDRNPYESMRPNLPTQSFVQKNSNNIEQGQQSPYPDINSSPQQVQEGYQDGFLAIPGQDNNQIGLQELGEQDFNKEGLQAKENQNPGIHVMNNPGGSPSQNPYDNAINNPTEKKGSDKINKNLTADEILDKTVKNTIPISKKSQGKEENLIINTPAPDTKLIQNNDVKDPFMTKTITTEVSKNPKDADTQQVYNPKNPFGEHTSDTVILSGNIPINPQPSSGENNNPINKPVNTINNIVSNPDNKENGGPTEIEPNNSNTNDTTGINPFASGVKLDDPFGVKTIPVKIEENKTVKKDTELEENEKNKSVQKSGIDPFSSGAKVQDPFGVDTL